MSKSFALPILDYFKEFISVQRLQWINHFGIVLLSREEEDLIDFNSVEAAADETLVSPVSGSEAPFTSDPTCPSGGDF